MKVTWSEHPTATKAAWPQRPSWRRDVRAVPKVTVRSQYLGEKQQQRVQVRVLGRFCVGQAAYLQHGVTFVPLQGVEVFAIPGNLPPAPPLRSRCTERAGSMQIPAACKFRYFRGSRCSGLCRCLQGKFIYFKVIPADVDDYYSIGWYCQVHYLHSHQLQHLLLSGHKYKEENERHECSHHHQQSTKQTKVRTAAIDAVP